ncbi:hypothetical protein AB0758_47330 [Tolypothrix bouteillei VB521301_2]|uniref:hypothetical protein n=1 Tax=Tolypothrix bouteillei TaxID=1246981 RepID=UPI0038B5682F
MSRHVSSYLDRLLHLFYQWLNPLKVSHPRFCGVIAASCAGAIESSFSSSSTCDRRDTEEGVFFHVLVQQQQNCPALGQHPQGLEHRLVPWVKKIGLDRYLTAL